MPTEEATESSPMTPDLHAHTLEQMTRWTVPGVVVGVLRDGERETRAYGVTSLETGYPVRPDTLFPIGSIAKVYTAALVMTLVDEGKLDLAFVRDSSPPSMRLVVVLL